MTDRCGDALDAFDDRFERLEPPVDWDEVAATLDGHRTVVE